jgi:hyaluronan synthase
MAHMNKFFGKRFFLFLCCVNVIFSVAILSALYVNRFSLLELHWIFWLITAYGFVVTPLFIFRLVSTYLYQPIPDRGHRPKISVIIPCFNEQADIGCTIDAIMASDYPKDLLELVVVDDKSSDDSLSEIYVKQLKHKFHVITHTVNMGKRHAVASGLRMCSGEFVVLIDSDTVVKSDAIKNLVQPFTDGKVFCVCGTAEVMRGKKAGGDSILTRFQKVWYNESFRVRKGVESLLSSVFCCSGVLSAYRADKLQEVLPDFLNERFLGVKMQSGDDRRLTNLMLRLGGKSVFQSNSVAYTATPDCMKKFVKQQVRWGRGSLRGMLFALTFFHHRPLKQMLLCYLTAFATLVSPIALVFSIFSLVVISQWFAVVGYFFGMALVAFLFALTDRLLVPDFSLSDILYRIGFFIVMYGLTFVYVYSWLTSAKNSWGTR